jgi:hypothetical protein
MVLSPCRRTVHSLFKALRCGTLVRGAFVPWGLQNCRAALGPAPWIVAANVRGDTTESNVQWRRRGKALKNASMYYPLFANGSAEIRPKLCVEICSTQRNSDEQ